MTGHEVAILLSRATLLFFRKLQRKAIGEGCLILSMKRERSQLSHGQWMKAVYLTLIAEFTALSFNDKNKNRKNPV